MIGIRMIIVRKRDIALVLATLLCILSITLTAKMVGRDAVSVTLPSDIPNSGYVIFAMNDLGMHCIQSDYSDFLILPPANNLKVQVFRKGSGSARLVSSGIVVSYTVMNNTSSADKMNFWEYAKDYGFDVPPNIGITGNGLKGLCKLSEDGKYYIATAIPVVPYNDGSKELAPYQVAKVEVTDQKSGKLLAVCKQVILPVSDEMYCSECHGTKDTGRNILSAHDKLSKTTLVADLDKENRHKCSECHKDNALGEPGKPGLPSFSLAIHGFHKDRMGMAGKEFKPVCYTCHPGLKTKCNRGRMYAAGKKCDNSGCHGDMAKVSETQLKGREAWLQEPDCSNPECHGPKYASNVGLLYKNSYLMNAPAPEMNGLIQCESCHNGTHSEWKSTLDLDNAIPLSLLGYAGYINKCTVCHQGKGKFHK